MRRGSLSPRDRDLLIAALAVPLSGKRVQMGQAKAGV